MALGMDGLAWLGASMDMVGSLQLAAWPNMSRLKLSRRSSMASEIAYPTAGLDGVNWAQHRIARTQPASNEHGHSVEK